MYYIFKVNRETVIPEFIDQILVSLGFSYNISSQASFFEGRGVYEVGDLVNQQQISWFNMLPGFDNYLRGYNLEFRDLNVVLF